MYVKYCKIYFTRTCTQNDERFPPASPLVLAEAGLGVVPSPKLEEDFKLRSLNWSILCFHFLCVTVCQCNSLRYNSIELICVSHPFVACIRVHVYIMWWCRLTSFSYIIHFTYMFACYKLQARNLANFATSSSLFCWSVSALPWGYGAFKWTCPFTGIFAHCLILAAHQEKTNQQLDARKKHCRCWQSYCLLLQHWDWIALLPLSYNPGKPLVKPHPLHLEPPFFQHVLPGLAALSRAALSLHLRGNPQSQQYRSSLHPFWCHLNWPK